MTLRNGPYHSLPMTNDTGNRRCYLPMASISFSVQGIEGSGEEDHQIVFPSVIMSHGLEWKVLVQGKS